MGKRYYCEFCDKSFADNPKGRKNHNAGLFHQHLKQAHYESVADVVTIIDKELSNVPCGNFLRKGHCDYEARCRYSHLNQKLIDSLRKQFKKESKVVKVKEPNVEEWQANRKKNDSGEETVSMVYSLPESWKNIGPLPPSLLPPQPEANQAVSEWG